MKPKEKKETLSEKCNRLEKLLSQKGDRIDTLNALDSSMRGRFTKVLGSTRLGGESYSHSQTEVKTLSWEEIFFQLGLISARMFNKEIRNDINDFRQRISLLEATREPSTVS